MHNSLKYLILLLPIAFIAATKSLALREFKITGFAQGTTYAINYYAKDSLVTKSEIDSIIDVIDESMSLYKPNSIISKFNKMPKGKMKIDPHMENVLIKSFEINKETDGLFDVTIQPLMKLWGFYKKDVNQIPDTSKIKSLIAETIGMDKIALQNNYLSKKNTAIEIDLNGIAQGYTVDVIANFFEQKGIEIYVVEVGGEVRAKGPKPNKQPIRIGIEGPSDNPYLEANIKHVISFKEGAVTTSGSYRKFISYNGKNYGHIISPKTGYPTNNQIISVTIFAKRAIDADGYDNALMLMSVQDALQFVSKHKNLETYIIYKKPDGKVADTLSAGFKKMVVE